MAFWYAFNEKHEDYTHADDSRPADAKLKKQVDADAREAGLKTHPVANNDELLSYAAAIYAGAIAAALVTYTGKTLDDLVSGMAELGGHIYGGKMKPDTALVNQLLDGALWSDRIWSNQDALRTDLTKLMKNALLTHHNPITESAKLRKRFGVMKYQSDRIIRTESSRVMSQQAIVNAKQAGFKKVVWVINSGACDICAPHDGKVYTMAQAEGLIPAHPNCLCSWAGYDEEDE